MADMKKTPTFGDRLSNADVPSNNEISNNNEYINAQISILDKKLKEEQKINEKYQNYYVLMKDKYKTRIEIMRDEIKNLQSALKKEELDDVNVNKENIEKREIADRKEKEQELLKPIKSVKTRLGSVTSTILNFTKNIAKLGLSISRKTFEYITAKLNCGLCDFFGNIGKMFNNFSSRKGVLLSIIPAVTKFAWKAITWVYEIGKKVIVWMWDKFKMLAKIGWNVLSTVWEFITTPANIIFDLFKEAFIHVITSPLGFIGMVVGFTFLLKFAITRIWPKIEKFMTGILKWAWNGIEQFFANVFTGGDKNKLEQTIEKYRQNIKEWLIGTFDWFIGVYDDLIGKRIGLDSSKIKEYVVGKEGIFNTVWGQIKDIFFTLYNEELLDEMKFGWEVVKDIYYALTSILGKDAAEVSVNSEERAYAEALRDENEKRFKEFYSQYINAYAQAELQTKLSQVYLENSTLENDKLLNILTSSGENILSAIKSTKFVSDANKNRLFVSQLDDSILKTIVSGLISDHTATNKDVVLSYGKTRMMAMAYLKKISEAANSFDPEYQKDILDKLADDTSEINTKIIDDANTTLIIKDKEVAANISMLGKDVGHLYNYLNTINQQNLGILEKTYKEAYTDTMSDLFREFWKLNENVENLTDTQLQNLKQKYLGEGTRERLLEHLQIQFGKFYTSDQIKNMRKMIWDDMYQAWYDLGEKRKKMADGSLVTGPTPVLVGEGNYPEIIVPLSLQGFDFIEKSMKELFSEENILDENTINKVEEKQNIIRKRMNLGKKNDIKMYDMKNISKGLMTYD